MSLTVVAAITAINDATTLLSVLVPLVKQAFGNDQTEITDADVTASVDKLNAHIAELDALIDQARQAEIDAAA